MNLVKRATALLGAAQACAVVTNDNGATYENTYTCQTDTDVCIAALALAVSDTSEQIAGQPVTLCVADTEDATVSTALDALGVTLYSGVQEFNADLFTAYQAGCSETEQCYFDDHLCSYVEITAVA